MTIPDLVAAGWNPFAGASTPVSARGPEDAARSDLATIVLTAMVPEPGLDAEEGGGRAHEGGEGVAELLGALLETQVQDRLLALELRAWAMALGRVPAELFGRPEAIAWDRVATRGGTGATLTSPGVARWSDQLGLATLAAERRAAEVPVFSMPHDPNHGRDALRIPAGAICRPAGSTEGDSYLGEAVLIAGTAKEED